MRRPTSRGALYVGDIYEIDIRGARNAGIEALLIDPLGGYEDVDCQRSASPTARPAPNRSRSVSAGALSRGTT